MKYTNLRASSDPKIIGVNNGVHQGVIRFSNFKDSKSENRIINYFIAGMNKSSKSIPQIDFELEEVHAFAKAKITDFFTFTPALYGIDFLTSERLHQILIRYKLPSHYYIPAYVHHKSGISKYYALYIPEFYGSEAVNFDKSVFSVGSIMNKQFMSFTSVEEYKSFGYAKAEKIVFNNSIDKSLDLFRSSLFPCSYFVSENLKSMLANESITNFVLELPENKTVLFD